MANSTSFIDNAKQKVEAVITATAHTAVALKDSALEFVGFKSKYKMLLIGETGSGKTSFLNLLCNYNLVQTLGFQVSLEHFRSFNDIQLENSTSRKMESKTSDAKRYLVKLCDLKIGVIDTPGFGDSRGMDVDKEHIRKIIDALKNEEYINCVCLVVNGLVSRMSATLKYVISEVTSILPKTVVNNVIVIFTNTTSPLRLNFDIQELEKYFGSKIEHFFCIENPYCLIEKAKEKKSGLTIDMIADDLKDEFVKTAKQLVRMLTAIEEFKPVHTNDFIRLYQKKEEIEQTVLTTLAAYNNQTRLEAKIAEEEQKLNAASRSKTLYQGFETTHKIKRTIIVKTECHNTLCGYPNCYSNCHVPCYLSKQYEKEKFKDCAAMGGDDTCKICHHRFDYHYHNEVTFKEVEEDVLKVDSEMKRKYNEAKSHEEKARIVRTSLEAEKRKSEDEKRRLSKQLLRAIEDFQMLGISRNYLKVLENQLNVIKQYLEGEIGPKAEHLRKTKEELERKIKVVKETLPRS